MTLRSKKRYEELGKLKNLKGKLFHDEFRKYTKKDKLLILKYEIISLQCKLSSLRYFNNWYLKRTGFLNKEQKIEFIKLSMLIQRNELLLNAYKLERKRLTVKYDENTIPELFEQYANHTSYEFKF